MNPYPPSTIEPRTSPDTSTRPLGPAISPEEPHIGKPEPPGRPRRRRWLWVLVLAALGVGAYYFYSRSQKQPPQPPTTTGTAKPVRGAGRGRGAMGVPPVVAVKAVKGNINVYFTGLGAVTPIYTVSVKSRVDGYLMQVFYKEGQIVHAGDALVEIDPRPYQVQLAQAQGQLIRDQALLENARIDLARYQQLIARRAIPEQTLATQKALVAQDAGTIQTDQAAIDSAKLNLVYCHITAPITGRLGLRLVDPGNYVQVASSTPLAVITQIDPISVIFTLPEDQLAQVVQRTQGGARLGVEAFDREMKEKLAQGYLSTVDNQIDQTTGTVKLRATFDNRSGRLFPNQFVNAKLLVEEKRSVTLLNNAAVQRNAQSTYVYLVRSDDTVTVRPVTLGASDSENTEIKSGIEPGDVVVMTGVDKLQEGSKVQVHLADEQGNAPEQPAGTPQHGKRRGVNAAGQARQTGAGKGDKR